MKQLIDIHVLQATPPSLPNRDDNGQPKTALFGNALRGRISSQSQKHQMRKADLPLRLGEDALAIRSRLHYQSLAERLVAMGRPEELALGVAQWGIKQFDGKDKKGAEAKGAEDKGKVLLHLTPHELDEMAALLNDVWEDLDPEKAAEAIAKAAAKKAKAGKGKKQPAASAPEEGEAAPDAEEKVESLAGKLKLAKDPLKAFNKRLPKLLQHPTSADLILFGRFLASMVDARVEAAMHVGHGLTTHAVAIEPDYFAGTDDLTNVGAGHIQTLNYLSGTLYRYASIDTDRAAASLGGDLEMMAEIALAATEAFIDAMPQAKAGAFAQHTRPAFVAVAVTRDGAPVNLVDAFEQPVMVPEGDSYTPASIDRLMAYWRALRTAYPQNTRIFVLSPHHPIEPEEDVTVVASLPELLEALRGELLDA